MGRSPVSELAYPAPFAKVCGYQRRQSRADSDESAYRLTGAARDVAPQKDRVDDS
jgi:hypothetical protein